MGIRRIVIHSKHIVMLRLFYGQIGAGVLQLYGEGNGAVAGDGVEIPAQIVGEIQRNLLGLPGVETAKAMDTHQGIINKMRPHLKHHDAGTLMGDLLLLTDNFLPLAAVLFDLIR